VRPRLDKLRFGLRARVTAVVVLVLLTAIALSERYLSAHMEEVLLDRMRADLVVRLELVERQASAMTVSMQTFEPWDALADDFALRSMTWLTVARPDGILLGDSRLTDLGSKLDFDKAPEIADALAHGFGESRRYSPTLEDRTLYVAVPFRMEDVVVGVVRLAVPLSHFDAAAQPIRRVLLTAWAIALLAALVLSWPAARLITGRLTRITAAARKMASGKLDTRTGVGGRDEVGELARVLDTLAEDLGSTLSEIRKVEAARREFVANASHELRTPLTAVCSAAETLGAGAIADPQAAREMIEVIEDNATRLRRLVEDLLDLSQLDAGRFPLKPEPIKSGPLVEKVVRSFRDRASARDVKLRCKVEDEVPAVVADWRALEHVLGNLVDNAVKYCTVGASVDVEVAPSGDSVLFSVQDTGPGIDEQHLPALFDRFYRADDSRSRETGGTGLGLAITKQLIEAMHGQIGVSSIKGEGSRFWFSLPVPLAPVTTPTSTGASNG
jgi:signal transduction histidine kinase